MSAPSEAVTVGMARRAAKEKANLVARCALAGYVLQELADGTFLLARWSFITPVADLETLAKLVDRIDGGQRK